MLKNKKMLSLLAIILIIVIAGTIMLFIKGMNYGLTYGDNTTIELYLETDFESADVQGIIKEVFGDNIKTRQVNNLKQDVLIITKSVSDEQLNTLVSKVNEKYGLELKTDDLLITNNTKISGVDLISSYILPICISTIAILVYFMIRYRKLGIYKVTLITILTIIIILAVYTSIYAIIRLPINEFTMPIAMILYVISIILVAEKFERDLLELSNKEE